MALQTFVKIGNISNLSDARYCAGMGVNILGFPLDPSSEESISHETFKEITEWISGIDLAGEFGNSSLEEIKFCVVSCDLQVIQTKNIDLVEAVAALGKTVIFKMEVISKSDVTSLKSKLSYLDELVKYVLISCEDTSLFESLDDFIRYYNGNVLMIKGYGIDETNFEDMAKFPGIELQGSPEERPGFKDYGRVMDILEELEEED
ncbi:MAG: hypothetical protein R8G66_00980 [Cytophagales bacterium]|nr:hypothetical protein [Cytophagales bacterium]